MFEYLLQVIHKNQLSGAVRCQPSSAILLIYSCKWRIVKVIVIIRCVQVIKLGRVHKSKHMINSVCLVIFSVTKIATVRFTNIVRQCCFFFMITKVCWMADKKMPSALLCDIGNPRNFIIYVDVMLQSMTSIRNCQLMILHCYALSLMTLLVSYCWRWEWLLNVGCRVLKS
jgi:hypothetical protein